MSDVHEKDQAAVDQVASAIGEAMPTKELAEQMRRLVVLVYAKGRLRGHQEGYSECARKALTMMGAPESMGPSHQVSPLRGGE